MLLIISGTSHYFFGSRNDFVLFGNIRTACLSHIRSAAAVAAEAAADAAEVEKPALEEPAPSSEDSLRAAAQSAEDSLRSAAAAMAAERVADAKAKDKTNE